MGAGEPPGAAIGSEPARIEKLGNFVALLALSVFLLGLGVVGWMHRAQK